MIDLKQHIASQLKIRLHFDGHWILISEMTFDSFIVPTLITTKSLVEEQEEQPQPQAQSQPKQPAYHLWIYVIVCVATMAIILMCAAILVLIRRTLTDHKKIRKHYFTPIHNHTHSSASTTSSDIDFNTTQHRYATIGPAHPYLLCTNGSLSSTSSPHYAKLMPTATLLRTPSLIQQNHIEGVCGNSALSTLRTFNFDLNQNQFIPMHQIQIKRKVDCRTQLLGGGEVNWIAFLRPLEMVLFGEKTTSSFI